MVRTTFKQKITLAFFGLFLGLVLLEIGLRAGGFILASLQERANRRSLQKKDAYRILCLGESTTARAYPVQLKEILNAKSGGQTFAVIDEGRDGTNTGIIVSELEDKLEKYKPDLVITMMGINDDAHTIQFGGSYEGGGSKVFIKNLRTYKAIKILGENISSRIRAIKGLRKMRRVGKEADTLVSQANDKTNGVERNYLDELKSEPETYEKYVELARFYRSLGRYQEAKEICHKAININPENIVAYLELANSIRDSRLNNSRAEEAYKEVIKLFPDDCRGYQSLAIFYKYQKRFDEAKRLYEQLLELTPNYLAYLDLGWCYEREEKYEQAEKLYKKALEMDPENDQAYGAIATCYLEQGKYESAQQAYSIAEKLRLGRYPPNTIHNYRKLVKIVLERGIPLLVVQYPVRSIKPLKKILGEDKRIFFVDNERVFKEALKKGKYKDYFMDNVGGDFGHCTIKGDRLLAGNITDTILEKIVGRTPPKALFK